VPAFKLRSFLVQHLKLSNKEVLALLSSKKVLVNGTAANGASEISHNEEIIVNGKVIREKKNFVYIKFYKPRGIESTLNKHIPDNLTTVFTFPEKLFPVGRLDKESEGLMIFTNDGEYYKRIADKNAKVEKEYVVTVNKPITKDFIEQMESGVKIMGKMTRPALLKAKLGAPTVFNLTLTEGMNRQIRRMCYKLGYEVERLVRVRIDKVELGKLKAGKWEDVQI
jgi:23S rRNA pseudouridine2604 synthase